MQITKSIVAVALLSCTLGGSTALAQGPAPGRYTPARPTISPYFAYSAINTTGLPNYYTYVQPLQQGQYAANARRDVYGGGGALDGRTTLTESSIDALLERRLSQRLTTGSGAPATAATFQNYSHFYPRPVAGRR